MNAPQSPYAAQATLPEAQPFIVLVAPENGADVTREDETDRLKLLSLTRSAGGQQLDHCALAYDLAEREERVIDTDTPYGLARKLQIRLTDPEDDPTRETPLFSGELATEKSQIQPDREEIAVLARVEPWHFGERLLGPKVGYVFLYSELSAAYPYDSVKTPHVPIRFNPEIDGKIIGNQNPKLAIPEDESERGQYALWLDPESFRTVKAAIVQSVFQDLEIDETTNEPIGRRWSLARAVHSLCWASNPDEPFVVNPTFDDCSGMFADAAEVVNVELPRGKYLPELLDALLNPFGYSWYLQAAADPDDEEDEDPAIKNHLKFFKFGSGVEVDVYLQRPGETLELTESNSAYTALEWNISDNANEIVGHGAQKEVEATFELFRGWPEADDDLTADELRRTDTPSEVEVEESQFIEKRDVWRKWVLNEAGDYCNTRETVAPIGSEPFDLTSLLGGETLAKRRKFYRPLTKTADKERWSRPMLEYRDPDVSDDGDPGAWKQVPKEWHGESFEVLDKECGIWFSGPIPPEELLDFESVTPGAARIRITATLKGDGRLSATATRQDTAANLNTIRLFVDLSHRFHKRTVQQTGDYKSSLRLAPFNAYGADTDDDTTALQTYVEKLRDLESPARLACEFVLFGIQPQYEIGQLVTKVNGRNISLNRQARDQAGKLYPQITSIELDRARQTTRLRVEIFDFPARSRVKLQLA